MHIPYFHLHDILENLKLQGQKTELGIKGGGAIDYKRDTGEYFGGLESGDGTVLNLDGDVGSMIVTICQNLQNSTLKKMDLYAFIF